MTQAPPETPAGPPPLPHLATGFSDIESVRRACEGFRGAFARLRDEVGRVIVGQNSVVDQTLIALFANGHVLLEGVPGLGKTLLVSTLARTLSLPFARIQFTADLMPADITGTSIVIEDPHSGRRTFSFHPGPIFHQLILADEINRATPKSQAALLEAMQERSVTVGGTTRRLGEPFFVMATQNPIEQEGTYPLPEAQLDRFLFKITVPYANRQEMNAIVKRTTYGEMPQARQIMDGPYILGAQHLARRIIIAPHVQDYAVRLVLATHPGRASLERAAAAAEAARETRGSYARRLARLFGQRMHRLTGTPSHSLTRLIRVGASPRAAQALVRAAKVAALISGRYAVAIRDIQALAPAVLRHRIIRSFEAEADGVGTDEIVQRLMEHVPREATHPRGPR